MTMASHDQTYPIRDFARLTGVNPVTLRAWERRYGVIQPQRTDKGHRYYTDHHLQRVQHILYWLEQGYPIRQVKLLLQDHAAESHQPSDDWQAQQQQLLNATLALDSHKLDELWNEGFANYPIAIYYQRCLQPVLETLRGGQHQPLTRKVFEHLLRRKLHALLQHQQKHNDGSNVFMATNHLDAELITLVCAYGLGAAGFRVHYFGSALTAEEWHLSATRLVADSLWLHFHPCPAREAQDWIDCLHKQQQTCFVSGAIPPTLSCEAPIVRLPCTMGPQIQQFITQQGRLL